MLPRHCYSARMDLFSDHQFQSLALPDADVAYCAAPELGVNTEHLCAELIDQTPWRTEPITLFGKTYMQPRLFAWYGNAHARYRYSGTTLEPLSWTEQLLQVRAKMESLAGAPFDSVLLNYYRDGNDSMGMHADDEPELGPEPVIASLSLGEARRFVMKHKTRRELPRAAIELTSGSVLLMRGSTQANWKHGISKSRADCAPRLNLTFRRILYPR